jgi:hypothetical protein
MWGFKRLKYIIVIIDGTKGNFFLQGGVSSISEIALAQYQSHQAHCAWWMVIRMFRCLHVLSSPFSFPQPFPPLSSLPSLLPLSSSFSLSLPSVQPSFSLFFGFPPSISPYSFFPLSYSLTLIEDPLCLDTIKAKSDSESNISPRVEKY